MIDVQELIAAGYHHCTCGALSRPERQCCHMCGRPTNTDPAGPPPARRADRGTVPPPNPQLRPGRHALGSLADTSIELVVPGLPRAEGSVTAVATGVVAPSDKGLNRWRNKITAEAERVAGPDWVAPNTAVAVSAVFTVPAPAAAPTTRPVHATGWRDLDKLLRAVCDGLCPSLRRKGHGKGRFRLLGSDMRVVTVATAKTHPRPLHTHPKALNEPGVWIRMTPAPHIDTAPTDASEPVSALISNHPSTA